MPFYRRKVVIVPLAIAVIFFAWRSYLWTVENYRPNLKQTQALTEVADQVYAIMLQNDLDWIQMKDGWVSPESLRSDTLESLLVDIESASSKIEQATFSYLCRDKCYFTAYFYIDKPPQGIIDGPYRYFQYNPDGHLKRVVYPDERQNSLTEYEQYNRYGWNEEFVPSISEARKEDIGKVYFFCEPLEQEYWHFCRGEYL